LRLPQARRRVALARQQRDRLGDERAERELLEQRVTERAPGGNRVERPGAVDDRVRELDAAEVDGRHACAGTTSRRAASKTEPSSVATTAPASSAAPAAWSASRKPSRATSGTAWARRTDAHAASGGMPTPPPTRIARGPAGGISKPLPSGPVIHSPSPGRSSP